MNSYLVFTDEAGTYKGKEASEEFRKAHPFYIRSFVLMESGDYRHFQTDVEKINADYCIPQNEEIKWDDLWRHHNGRGRTGTIQKMEFNYLKSYYCRVLSCANQCNSIKYVFTITFNYDKSCLITIDNLYKFHLQNAFQRISMELSKDDFALLIMDDLSNNTVGQIKNACHNLTVNGDFLNYGNLYHGILTENSIYCPGVQLADYVAGVINGVLRRKLLNRGKYDFSMSLYHDYVENKMRVSGKRVKIGYGIVDVPRREIVRTKLMSIFDNDEKA